MKLKANLHLHTNDDLYDNVKYSLKEAVDYAVELEYRVLALTCHKKIVDKEEYRKYAEDKGILLIKGAELNINRKHVVVLNAEKDIENIKNFDELRRYRQNHPEIFIIAPHPYFKLSSLGKYLEKYIDVFDAIEHSWFYSKSLNFNKKAIEIAKKYKKPPISTSDTHEIKWLDNNFTLIDAKEKTAPAIFDAVRNSRFENITSPLKTAKDMVPYLLRSNINYLIKIISGKNGQSIN